MKTIFTIICLGLSFLQAQSVQQIERDLVNSYQKIIKSGQSGAIDSLAFFNEQLGDKLLQYGRNMAVLRYGFPRLKALDGFYITTAPNGKFRIYSWDTFTGGTMVFYENIYQYQVGNRSKALKDNTGEEGNPKSFFSDIFQFQHNNETHYLGYYHAKFSTMDIAQGVKCFKLKDEEMDVNARFIRTQTGMHNTLGFSFDFFSVVDRPERPVKLISFIPSTKTLSIPVVTENNQVTRRSIRYRFRNGQFERL